MTWLLKLLLIKKHQPYTNQNLWYHRVEDSHNLPMNRDSIFLAEQHNRAPDDILTGSCGYLYSKDTKIIAACHDWASTRYRQLHLNLQHSISNLLDLLEQEDSLRIA